MLNYFFYSKIWNSYRFFKKRGIPTPKYKLLLGNLTELYQSRVHFKFIVFFYLLLKKLNYFLKE